MKKRVKNSVIFVLIGITLMVIISLAIYFFGKTQVNTGNLINRVSTRIFDYNTIDVKCNNKSLRSSILIFYGNNCIYKNGTVNKGIKSKYGWNCFDVYFQGRKKYKICHFKKNNWHVNKYLFEFNLLQDSLNVIFKIRGPDSKEKLYYKYFKESDKSYDTYFLDKKKNIYKIESKQFHLDKKSERKITKQIKVLENHKMDTIHKQCNIKILLTLEDHLENPSDKELNNFFETFDESCKTNIEYSEFSNELLFKVLQKYPNRAIQILKNNKNIKRKYILKELQNPVHDGFNISNIIKKIEMNKDTISIKIVKTLKEIH